MSVKILHTADIHLDSPFTAFTPSGAQKRREALRKSFLNLIEIARKESVQLFFISGDLFDSEYATRDTALTLKNAFASLPSCMFFISPGNHDPFTAGSVYNTAEFPDNVHVFKERQCITLDDLKVRVYGYGFTSSMCEECTVSGYDIPQDDYTNILVCHGDMSGVLSSNGPVTKRDIAESGFDYIALGHIHKGTDILCENGVYYAYPGCPCGRSFDETGEKHALIGDISKESVSLAPVCVSEMRYESIRCDVSDTVGRREALDKMRRSVSGFSENTVVRVFAVGNTEREYLFAKDELAGQTDCSVTVIDNTRPVISFTDIESENTLKGVFYKMMQSRIASLGTDTEEYYTAVRALKYGLTALEDESITDFGEEDK